MVSAGADVTVLGHKIKYSVDMQLRYNYRLDPWPRHRIALGKAFGCARVVFNDALAAREAAYEAGEPYVTDAELSVSGNCRASRRALPAGTRPD
jgi:hypothetical protein